MGNRRGVQKRRNRKGQARLVLIVAIAMTACATQPDTTINCSTLDGSLWLDCNSPLCQDDNCIPLTETQIQQFQENQPREDFQEDGA